MKMRAISRVENKKFRDKNNSDYQLERLHIYGDEHPFSGLKNKVVGWQFRNTLDVMNPVKKTTSKEPLKPFMVNQLALAFERERLILSPFDDVLHKQLVDYTVEKITEAGLPKYTSKNEHFVDALGLAYLAFVLNFPDITQGIKKIKNSMKMEHTDIQIGAGRANAALREITTPVESPWKRPVKQIGKDYGELPGDYQKWVKVPLRSGNSSSRSSYSWGNRASGKYLGRSMW